MHRHEGRKGSEGQQEREGSEEAKGVKKGQGIYVSGFSVAVTIPKASYFLKPRGLSDNTSLSSQHSKNRQKECCEFESSMSYTVNSGPAWAI